MSRRLDANRLIAEVKRRPALWDMRLAEYKDRALGALLWRDIANNVGCQVDQCKRKWKNIRDAYRAEVRRIERRSEQSKLEGHANPQVVESKWAFFKPMSFISEKHRNPNSTPSPHEVSSDSQEASDQHDLGVDEYCIVKMEHPTTDEEVDLKNDNERRQHRTTEKTRRNSSSSAAVKITQIITLDDDEEANDKLFQEFQTVATPQAARRLSGTLTLAGGFGSNPSPPTTSAFTATVGTGTAPMTTTLPISTMPPTAVAPFMKSNHHGGALKNATNCKCSQREDQVHFLEDLEREEQQLMKSTRRDITRANSMSFYGDSDYNFLVSFLPQMKRLSELQNLQFRAKMSEIMLHIMAQPTSAAAAAAAAATAMTAFSCTSTTTSTLPSHNAFVQLEPQQQHHHHHHNHPITTQQSQLLQQQSQSHLTDATTTQCVSTQPK